MLYRGRGAAGTIEWPEFSKIFQTLRKPELAQEAQKAPKTAPGRSQSAQGSIAFQEHGKPKIIV